MVLHELLGLPEREKHVVSLCGGGGKTTLMYALARETKTILPTALFTTTHIMTPSDADVLLSVRFLCREASAVIIEADGARRLPVKFPAAREPVIRPETTHTIVVAGLTALGKKPEEIVHRYALAKNTVDLSGGSLTEKQMAELLWAGYGRFAPIFFINQADTGDLAQRGERICAMLRDFGARRAVTASLHALKKSYERG